MDKECKCDKCSKDLVANSGIAIHCDSGDHWFCYNCIDMSQRLFDSIIAEGDTSMLFVSCSDCRASSFPIAAIKKSSSIEFKAVNDRIDILSKKLDSFTDIENNVKESIKLIKDHTVTSKLNYADMVKKSIESSEEIRHVKEAVQVSAKEHSEHDERDRSIMIFNAIESKQGEYHKRCEEDLSFVEKFIGDGLSISAQEIQSCVRLGFYKDDVKRPLKVTFMHKSNQVKVTDHLFRLRDADQVFKDLSVSIDRSREEREVYKKLVVSAGERTRASNDKKYVVRGTYKPVIVERNK